MNRDPLAGWRTDRRYRSVRSWMRGYIEEIDAGVAYLRLYSVPDDGDIYTGQIRRGLIKARRPKDIHPGTCVNWQVFRNRKPAMVVSVDYRTSLEMMRHRLFLSALPAKVDAMMARLRFE